jgi:hypothetical protein
MSRQEGTVKQKLFAVRYAHLVAGHDDPTLRKSGLWAALAGIKRWRAGVKRKYLATPKMLRWVAR